MPSPCAKRSLVVLTRRKFLKSLRENVADWVEAFLNLIARRSVSGTAAPTFVKSALEDAGITDAKKQETFARLFNEHKALTPELVGALEKDTSFKKEEIADLRTSFRVERNSLGAISPSSKCSRKSSEFANLNKFACWRERARTSG